MGRQINGPTGCLRRLTVHTSRIHFAGILNSGTKLFNWIFTKDVIPMIAKRIYKLLPMALLLVCMGIWSARASLFEIYDAAVEQNALLDAAHPAPK